MEEIAEKKVPASENKRLKVIDFNCDAAQGFGVFNNNAEEQIFDFVSSVNISTGFHAGDPMSIKKSITEAKKRHLALGVHIGFDDMQGFGNRPMNLSEDELEALVVYQVGALISFANAYNVDIEYVRPHGAMYRLASENFTYSCSIAKAIKKCSQWLTYYGAAGDTLAKTGEYVKIRVAHELKLNKVYNENGTVDWSSADIMDTPKMINRLHNLIKTSKIDNNSNGMTSLTVDTIHFPTSTPNALITVKRANEVIKPTPNNYNSVVESGWVKE